MSTVQITSPLPLSSHAKPVDSFRAGGELENELKRSVKGEVRFDRGSRALYATDGSNYRQIPIGLVVPRDDDDVIAAVAACRKFGAPVLPRGAGTSLAGQCCNVAVVLDFTKYMNRILEIDPAGRFARVQPGVVLDTLRNRAEKHQLTFGPDPSTHSRCTLGGMIGNNSCGTHSLLGGQNGRQRRGAAHPALRRHADDGGRDSRRGELDSIIAQGGRRGEIYSKLRDDPRPIRRTDPRASYPKIPRRVSGYNLDQLLPENGFNVARALVGTEGTCVIVLEAKLRLIHSPQHRTLVGLGYRDTFSRRRSCAGNSGVQAHRPRRIRRQHRRRPAKEKARPTSSCFPRAAASCWWNSAPTIRPKPTALAQQLDRAAEADRRSARTCGSTPRPKRATSGRFANPGRARPPPLPARRRNGKDGTMPRSRRKNWAATCAISASCSTNTATTRAFYGHFGHGCIHMRVSFDLQSEDGIRKYGEFVERAADLVVSYGGSLSGEHGDGQSRGALLPKMFGPELIKAFGEFKSAWDPGNRMNPHKVVNAYLPTENLRLGADYKPLDPQNSFSISGR